MDADALTIANSADSDFDLPLVGLYGSEISWTSDNSDVIAAVNGLKESLNKPIER